MFKTVFIMDFFTFSGWLFGLISLIFAVVQLIQKNKYKKQIKNIRQEQNIGKRGTGYQAGETININK